MTRNAVAHRTHAGAPLRVWLCLLASAALLFPLLAGPAQAQWAGGPLAQVGPATGAAGQRFSLDFVATDMVDVLKALAAQSGANIAVSSQVSGQVTLRLSDVTVEEALAVVTKLNGLSYGLLDNTYVVGTPDEVRALTAPPPSPDVPQTRVLALKYLPPDDAVQLLRTAEPGVSCSRSPTGGLILSGMPAELDRAAALLAGIDVAPAVSVADRAVYTVRYADPLELVETLKAIFPDLTVTPAPRTITPLVTPPTYGALQGGLAALAAPQLTTAGAATGSTGGGATGGATGRAELSPVTRLVLSGAPATLSRALKMCQDLDVAPRQVKIDVTITEVRSDVEKRLGINWQELTGSQLIVGEAGPGGDFPLIPGRDLKVGKIERSHLNFTGVLSALVTEGSARIMANPSLTILDGRQASIHAGDKIYYPQVVGYTPLGGQIVSATEIDIGVNLIVNPRVGPDGDVTLTLVPSISDIAESVFAGYPTITERSTVTTVRIKSGETLAIGGLLRDSENVTVNKVPVLGDIPVVGDLLFKHKVKRPSRSEVLIIITPSIVEG